MFVPGLQGLLQTETLAAIRSHEAIAYQLPPRLDRLAREGSAWRPVRVLQNLGNSLQPSWHYAVVISLDIESERVVLRSGTTKRLVMDAPRLAEPGKPLGVGHLSR